VVEVSYQLTIDGQAAAPELVDALQRLEAEEHADMASIMRLTVAIAVAAEGGTWTVVDDGAFPRFSELALSIKVGSAAPEPVLTAYVIETRTVFDESPGESSMDVVAMDASALMNLEEKVRPWPNMSDSDIAEAIFGEYGLRPVVERAEPTWQEDDTVPMQRGTDAHFLKLLAERNGFELFVASAVDGLEGHFHPPKLDERPQGVLTIGFGGAGNVARLTVTHDALLPTVADAAQVGAESGEDESGSADAASLPDLGGESVLPGPKRRTTLLAGTGAVGTAELQTFAQAVVDRSTWAVRAEGELSTMRYEGLLRARRPVSLRGAGRNVSGPYYVERVLHAFTEEGYSQQFTLRRNALGLSGAEDFATSEALPS
jgi:phage protein D